MNNQNISIEEYEKLPSFFNPVYFDAEEWVLMAKDAGMKYITITSRHHDGFSMFDSKASDYNIIEKTPYAKDVLKMLAEACKKHDLKLFFIIHNLTGIETIIIQEEELAMELQEEIREIGKTIYNL